MSNHIHKITFPPEEDDFFLELRNQVNNYFKSSGKSIYGDYRMYTKIALLLIVYFIVFLVPLILDIEPLYILLCYSFLGIWGVFLGVNIGHDAAHNSLFKSKKYKTCL